MSIGIEIIATDIEDTSNEVSTTPATLGVFPGVVCFYRSKDQSNFKYGRLETDYSSDFGFDTYIPSLYGLHANVVGTYNESEYIVTSYIGVDNSNRPKDIHVYPTFDEREHGTPPDPVDATQRINKKYRIPWLNPVSNDITLHYSVLFPPNISNQDDYIRSNAGATCETIKFKIVQVDANWKPQKEEVEETIDGVTTKRPVNRYKELSDGTLSLGMASKDFTFSPYAPGNRFTIEITRTGNNPKASLIAYFGRLDGSEIREYIVGQVNILPYEYFKTVEKYTDFCKNNDIPCYLNPLPIHYVQIVPILYNEREDNLGNITLSYDLSNPLLPKRQNLSMITPTLINYFSQAGINFVENRKQHSILEVKQITRLNGTECLRVNNVDFEINYTEDEGINYKLVRTEVGLRTLTTQFAEEFKRILKEKILLKNLPPNSEDIGLDKIDSKYLSFLQRFEALIPVQRGMLLRTSYNSETLKELTDNIINYLIEKTLIMFILPDIYGGVEVANSELYSMGYVYFSDNKLNDKGDNKAVIFNSGMNNMQGTIPHEIGHALDLQHSFESSVMMYPQRVNFNSDADWTTQVQTMNGTDHGGYAATFDNIMDYASLKNSVYIKNNNFVKRSFTKKQWQVMTNKLVYKSLSCLEDAASITKSYGSYDEVHRKYIYYPDFIKELLKLL